MHIEYPVDLIHREGSIHRCEDLESLQRVRGHISAKHREVVVSAHSWNGELEIRRTEVTGDWIARDAIGGTVLYEDVPPPERTHGARRLRSEKAVRRAIELGQPIPDLRKAWCKRWGPFRSVHRYVAEHAANDMLAQDLREAGLYGVRVCRTRNLRPDPWEDAPKRHAQRCWKTQRRTKWKD